MAAARRVTSTSVDSLRKRERQVMAAAFDLAAKGGAFSISFVAKRTSVKALIYFTAPKGADAHLEAEEQEDVVDEAETEEGGRAMPSGAKEQHRARRDANPAYAQPTAPKRTSGHPNGINVQCAQQRGSRSTATKGRAPKARVDRNALSARSDGAATSKRPKISPTAISTVAERTPVRQCQEVDSMESEEPNTQDGDPGGESFIASPSFAGPRPGYVFTAGSQGVGYYTDHG